MTEGMRAPLYKFHKDKLSKEEFTEIMTSLPVDVAAEEIDEMFKTADLDRDEFIDMTEFSLMVSKGRVFKKIFRPPFRENKEFLTER